MATPPIGNATNHGGGGRRNQYARWADTGDGSGLNNSMPDDTALMLRWQPLSPKDINYIEIPDDSFDHFLN